MLPSLQAVLLPSSGLAPLHLGAMQCGGGLSQEAGRSRLLSLQCVWEQVIRRVGCRYLEPGTRKPGRGFGGRRADIQGWEQCWALAGGRRVPGCGAGTLALGSCGPIYNLGRKIPTRCAGKRACERPGRALWPCHCESLPLSRPQSL